jgi:predicted ATPase
MSDFYLPAVRIRGYRPFRDVLFRFNRLEVIIGANGSGKTSLFEFLKFLRNACHAEIPHQIVPDSEGQTVFHKPGADRIFWNAQIDYNYKNKAPLFYQGELQGGNPVKVGFERIFTKQPLDSRSQEGFTFMDFRDGKGLVRDPVDGDFLRKEWKIGKSNQLGLGAITDSNLEMLHQVRDYIQTWRFYDSSRMDIQKIKKPRRVVNETLLDEDGGNLAGVLFNLKSDHPEAFEDLKSLIRFAITGFKNLDVKTQDGTRDITAFWSEDGIEGELNFNDLSDGVLRFITLAALCVIPSPPPLICIDTPEQGLHPRTLPVLAGLFEKAAERTQVLLTTHDSYFLTQFALENISIMKKSGGSSAFVNVRNSQALLGKLEKSETEEIEQMYRADELESLF